MTKFRPAVMTDAGQSLATQAESGQIQLTFTKGVLSSDDLTQLGQTAVQQTTALNPFITTTISKSNIISANKVALPLNFSNEQLTQDNYAKTVGVYASDGKNEYLYAICINDAPLLLSAYNGSTPEALEIEFRTEVGRASTVNVTISPLDTVSRDQLSAVSLQLSSASSSNATMISSNSSAISGLQTQINANNSGLWNEVNNTINPSIASNSNEINSLKGNMNNISSTVANNSGIASSFSSVNSAISNNSYSINSLATSVTNLNNSNSSLTSLATSVATNSNNINSLATSVSSNSSSIYSMSSAINGISVLQTSTTPTIIYSEGSSYASQFENNSPSLSFNAGQTYSIYAELNAPNDFWISGVNLHLNSNGQNVVSTVFSNVSGTPYLSDGGKGTQARNLLIVQSTVPVTPSTLTNPGGYQGTMNLINNMQYQMTSLTARQSSLVARAKSDEATISSYSSILSKGIPVSVNGTISSTVRYYPLRNTLVSSTYFQINAYSTATFDLSPFGSFFLAPSFDDGETTASFSNNVLSITLSSPRPGASYVYWQNGFTFHVY